MEISNQDKIILDLCGGTGSWSKPYRDAGYDVRVITLPDFDIRTATFANNCLYFSSKGDITTNPDCEIPLNKIYGILSAPPCTMFSLARTKAVKPRDLEQGMETVIACLNIIWTCQYDLKSPHAKETRLKFWALENPKGLLKRFLGKPVLEFDPWEYGDEYQKKTHIWGWFNEPKKKIIKKPQGDLALYKSLTPSKRIKFDKLKTKEIAPEFYGKLTRTERRAITPQGFAKAFFEANK